MGNCELKAAVAADSVNSHPLAISVLVRLDLNGLTKSTGLAYRTRTS
jgi:hypothetical protein